MSTAGRRILVALDTSAGSRAALRRAAELARRVDAELAGLFVQDENLLQLAALPFARELSASGGARRTLSADAMERELSRQAVLLEEELEAIAASLDIRWSFQIRRGRVAAEILAAFAGHDLVAIGRAGMQPGFRRLGSTARSLLAGAGFPVMLIGPQPARAERVLAIFDESPSARPVVRRALELTPPGQPLHVLVWASGREELASLETALIELAGSHALEIHELVGRDESAMMERVMRIAPTVLVVGQVGALAPTVLEALAGRLDGAVLRIPAPGGNPTANRARD